MAVNSPNSPRQKMINLMYLVFIGMLALNVSTEVLEGFELVEESLLRSVEVATQRNKQIFSDLQDSYTANPDKTQEWYDKGSLVKQESDTLFNYIQEIKLRIAKKTDGKNGDPEHIKRPDDLNAAYDVMFDKKKEADKLKSALNDYRQFITPMVNDPSIQNIVENNLSTEPSATAKANKQTWEESMFWQMPVAAVITLLTKMQKDIRDAESAVLGDLIKHIDLKDFRVNTLEAYIIPETQIVMRGNSYKAKIGMLAYDSTQHPRIFVNNKQLPDNQDRYVAGAGSTGTFQVRGYIEMPQSDGSFVTRNFSTEYYVIEPSATVAPVLMNMLYAGIENDIRIAVPGATGQNVSATISNGTLTQKGNGIWVAKPQLGSDAVITVTAKMVGSTQAQKMAEISFRVRALPNPTPYVSITNVEGNRERYKGGPIAKAALVAADALSAAIDDGILDQPFTVVRFNLVKLDKMGFRSTIASEGAHFTQQQKDMMRDTPRGHTLLISGIEVRSPAGDKRTLNTAMEIIVN